MALHPAFMINQRRRGQNRMVITGEPELKEVVHEIVVATKSEELLTQMIEELKGIREDFEQDRAERAFRESPYSGSSGSHLRAGMSGITSSISS